MLYYTTGGFFIVHSTMTPEVVVNKREIHFMLYGNMRETSLFIAGTQLIVNITADNWVKRARLHVLTGFS